MTAQQPAEAQTESPIARVVQKVHGSLLHRVEKARSVGKVSGIFGNGKEKSRQIFRRHRHVCIQNHHYIAGGSVETLKHRGSLPSSRVRLVQELDVPPWRRTDLGEN